MGKNNKLAGAPTKTTTIKVHVSHIKREPIVGTRFVGLAGCII